MDDDRILDASRRLAAALQPGDLDTTLTNITAAAVEVLPDVRASSITVKLFAHQSAVALDYARQVDQLQEAVKSRQVIGQAVGMVMERYSVDEARAFGFLTRLSSHENMKLRLVAEQLVKTASTDDTVR